MKVFPIILDDELNRRIEEYMIKKGIKTKRDAILELIKKGLERG